MVSPHDRLQGPRVDGRRLDRRGARLGGAGQLPMVGGRQLPDSRVHGQASGQGRDDGHPAHRLGPGRPSRSGRGSSIRKGASARGNGAETATAGSSSIRPRVPKATTVSATHIMVKERPDLVRWTSTDRFVGHESIPDEREPMLSCGSARPRAARKTPAHVLPRPKRERSPQ